jgi:thiol-disulfide isomerase/thioredoxin
LLYARKTDVISVAFMVIVIMGWSLCGPRWASAAGGVEGTSFQFFKNPPAANDVKLGMLDGRVVHLSGLKGKVVVLNFWRKNCQYCGMEKGALKNMLQSMHTDDLKVVCANFWDQPSWVMSYGKSNGGDLIIASRPQGTRAVVENVVRGRLMGYYIVNDQNEAIYEIKGFPSSYVINKEGRVVAAHLGLAPWNSPPVRKWLTRLVSVGNSKAAPAPDYELPGWLDRLLTNPLGKSLGFYRGPGKTAALGRPQ